MNKAIILKTKEKVKFQILAIPGVTGIGVGPENINIYVVEITPEIVARLPEEIEGIPVRIIESGEIIAVQRLERTRPAPGGVSIGNISITAGTLGMVARDNLTKKRVILSNAHILCSSPFWTGQVTSEIVQPGIFDDGIFPDDHIADLLRWVQLYTKETNKINIVDCAIADPLNDEDIDDEILEVGEVKGTTEAYVYQEIMKSGRNGLAYGTVLDVNADVSVGYMGAGTAIFTDQIITSKLLTGGDSGSIVMDNNKKVIGIGFAASFTISVLSKIDNVFNHLNISIPEFINKEEYLSRITKRIPIEKIPVIIEKEKFPFEKWFVTEPGEKYLWWMHKPFEGKDYSIFIDIYESNPPTSSDKIIFRKYDPITGWESPNEIPKEVAEKSLKALYPARISPLILTFVPLLLIPVLKKFK